MEEKLEKKTLADCWNHVVEGTRRGWVQGHVVSLDGAQHTAVIDDGTATFPLNFHADDNQKGCGLGEYTMIIGNIGASPPSLTVHQCITLKDPNREVMWWGEMILAAEAATGAR